MSRDGTWQDPEPHPGGEAFVPRALGLEIAKLAAELRAARLTIAAIVTQHGESLGDGRYRLVVDPAHLETAEARQLAVITEPNSGAMLLRVRPL